MDLLSKIFTNLEAKDINEKERSIVHYISTRTIDEYKEILMPDGVDTSKFKAVLWMHSLGWNWISDVVPPPSALVIGKNLWFKSDDFGVIAKTQFAQTELGDEIFRFNKEGLIKSWSVGWRPKDKKEVNDETGITTYKTWYLYEYSSVIVPANADAVNLMLGMTKDFRLKNVLNKEKETIEIKNELNGYKTEMTNLKSLIDEVKNSNNNSAEITQLKEEIEQLKLKLTDKVGKAKSTDKSKWVQEAMAGALSELTGKKIKS